MTDDERKLELIASASAEFLSLLARSQGALLDGLADRPKAGKKKVARDALVAQLEAARELRQVVGIVRGSKIVGSMSGYAPAEVEQSASPYARVLADIQKLEGLEDGWADGEGEAIQPSSVSLSINALRHMAAVFERISVLPGSDGSVCFSLLHGGVGYVLAFVGDGKVEVSGTRDDGEVPPYLVGIESRKFRKLWA